MNNTYILQSVKSHSLERQFKGMVWSSRVRSIWGWGIHRYRYFSPPVSFRIKRLVNKQVLKNSNLGSFLKFWKGQKREPGLI